VVIAEIQRSGKSTQAAIAQELEARGVRTPAGRDRWRLPRSRGCLATDTLLQLLHLLQLERCYWPKPTGNRMPTATLKTALGEAVAAVWGKLPAEVQRSLFEAAIESAGEGFREKLAVYLHGRHPRTVPSSKPGREVPEPDSLGG
jgi:hypothetical protein